LSDTTAAVVRAIFNAGLPGCRVGRQYGYRVAVAAGFDPETVDAAFSEIESVL
jgi:hypothetical protein